mmetsp:Transcript_397/g.764  ORF Transcript_397/g.764 Transcript_397/m.764 type:complete len:230 (-) Transcript_397:268-957(-)
MWSALMCFPQVAVLASHIAFHGLRNDEIALASELRIGIVILGAELLSDEIDAHVLEQTEQTVILNTRHLDDLRNAVTQPTRVKGAEELTISEGQDWRMVGAVQVLVPIAVAARTWGRTSVNPRDDGGTEHDVWCVAMVEGTGKASNVRDDTSTHYQHRLISRDTGRLQVDENPFHVVDVLVCLATTVDELLQLNPICLEVVTQSRAVVFLHLVVDDGHRPTEGLVDMVQ